MSPTTTTKTVDSMALASAAHRASSPIPHPSHLQIGAFEPRSLVNGPGARAVLWVQGCGRRCPGCFNPEFLPRAGGRMVRVDEIIQWIATAVAATGGNRAGNLSSPAPGASSWPLTTLDPPSSAHGPPLARSAQAPTTLEGITFSGGEPFDQAPALAVVARAAREIGLSVLVFTGHPWEELRCSADPGHRGLLEASDLLVAGPYERDQPGAHPLLASANQQLVFLTDRYRAYDFGRQRRIEFRIASDGTLRTTGFPPSSAVHHPPSQNSLNP